MDEKKLAAQIYKDVINKVDIGELILKLISDAKTADIKKVLLYYSQIKKGELKVVEIYAAKEINDNKKSSIEKYIQQSFKEELVFVYEIDSTLLGGFYVKIGDDILDKSIRNKLDTL